MIRNGGMVENVPALPDYLENWDFARAEEKK